MSQQTINNNILVYLVMFGSGGTDAPNKLFMKGVRLSVSIFFLFLSWHQLPLTTWDGHSFQSLLKTYLFSWFSVVPPSSFYIFPSCCFISIIDVFGRVCACMQCVCMCTCMPWCVWVHMCAMHSCQPLLGVKLSPEFVNLYFPYTGLFFFSFFAGSSGILNSNQHMWQ